MEEKNTKLFGLKIATGSREELFSLALPLLWHGGAIATVNPEILSDSLENLKLRAYLKGALCIPDGVGVKLALSRMGIRTEVLPGVELGELLLDQVPVRLGIIGGGRGVAEEAMKNLMERHCMVKNAFAMCGYGIRDSEYESAIAESGAEVVFVCLGSPRQELFISSVKGKFPKVLFVGLGGAADIYSGRKRRAPGFMRALGLEWLFRILREPKRLKRTPKIMNFLIKSRHFCKKTGKISKKRKTWA